MGMGLGMETEMAIDKSSFSYLQLSTAVVSSSVVSGNMFAASLPKDLLAAQCRVEDEKQIVPGQHFSFQSITCAICLDIIQLTDLQTTPCGHVFCKT